MIDEARRLLAQARHYHYLRNIADQRAAKAIAEIAAELIARAEAIERARDDSPDRDPLGRTPSLFLSAAAG